MKVERIVSNKAQCRSCNVIIESKHRHDFVWCKCGAIAVDGGNSYLKRCGELTNLIELSESYEAEVEDPPWMTAASDSPKPTNDGVTGD